MTNRKVWVITGVMDGLGPAAVKYLLSKQQTVIALNLDNEEFGLSSQAEMSGLETINLKAEYEESAKVLIKKIVEKHGLVDYLIVNGCYTLIDHLKQSLSQEINMVTCHNLDSTMYLVKFVLPYMKPKPDGHIISIPVKNLILDETGEPISNHLSDTIEDFSGSLHDALAALNMKLTFIEPGNQMPGLFCS